MNNAWTDERVELLKKLWVDGPSCSLIAAELGGGLSRCAVIGKARRLGLPSRAEKSLATTFQRKPRKSKKARPRPKVSPLTGISKQVIINYGTRFEIKQVADPDLPETPVNDLEIPLSQRKSLLELTAETCRWPIGDPQDKDFFFCGAEPCGPSPYCLHHSKIAYQPQTTKSKEEHQCRVEGGKRAWARRQANREWAA